MDKLISWSIAFLIIALIAGIFGFGGIAGTGVGIAKVLFFAFLVVGALGLVTRLVRSATA